MMFGMTGIGFAMRTGICNMYCKVSDGLAMESGSHQAVAILDVIWDKKWNGN